MIHLFFILSCLIPSLLHAKELYTEADLKVLTQEGSYEEFFAHALDIRPSERKKAWMAMVSKMGDSYTKGILGRSEIRSSEFNKVEQLWKWPGLKSDDVFKARRQEIGLRYLKNCLKGPDPCWKEVSSFWEADQTDPDTAFKLAQLISQHKNSPLLTWNFLEVALKSSLSEFYCQKEFALKALWAKLEVDYIRLGIKGDMMKKIDETVHPACLQALVKEARQRLMYPEKSGDRELGHQVLLSQSKADEATTDFFHTVYLLENPSQGELFNYSWNRLKELGNSSKRREAVLEKLKTLDPLPDKILTSFDEAKKRVILTFFNRQFPEYFDHYAKQCVHFYGGKSNFPNGNPTMHCQDLMKSELAREIVGHDKIRQYQNVRKI